MAFPSFTKLAAAIWPSAATDTDKADLRLWGLEGETAINALFSQFGMVNGQLIASVAANVLTIAVKRRDGSDASATDPIYIPFRHATQTDGSETVIKLTAALSLTISAGSTLGAVDAEAARFWIVCFNDGGTLRMGAINCLEMTATTQIIHPLDESTLQSSTAEGGAGAADTAGVIYTGSAVTTKAMRIIGHVTWEANALATAGLYASAPDIVQMASPRSHRPGDIVQTRRVIDVTEDATTTVTPADDTIPQLSTEGETQLSRTITAVSRANLLEIESNVVLAGSAASTLISALHQDSIENALAARHADVAAANDSVQISLRHFVKALTQTEKTFKINNGPTTGTLTMNGAATARLLGGINESFLQVREIFV